MRVDFDGQLADFVQRKLDGGLYSYADEVITAALKLLERRDKKLAALRGTRGY